MCVYIYYIWIYTHSCIYIRYIAPSSYHYEIRPALAPESKDKV